MHKYLYLFFFINIINQQSVFAQVINDYGYGSVIGGEKSVGSIGAKSLIGSNEQGIRVVLIRSQSQGISSLRGGGNSGGGVQIFEVPKDTDFLELLVFYAGIDPRGIHQNNVKLLRVKSTGTKPYNSMDIHRYWTKYNFKNEYDLGGPFELLRPGDIVIVEGRGLFNRPFFDPLTDINFLLTLPTLILSVLSLYNTLIR